MTSLLLITSLLAYIGCCLSADPPTHTAVGYCTKLQQTNQLEYDFRLAVNNDPNGTVRAKDSTGNFATCNIVYDSAQKLYTFKSVVNLDNNQVISNACGVQLQVVPGSTETVFIWRVGYYELPNRLDVTLGKNRMYTATCNTSTTESNRRNSEISISSPNIDQTITTTVPPITLSIWYQTATTGVYAIVDSTTLALDLDTFVRLQLRVDFGTFSPSSIYGVGGLLTEFSGFATFPSSDTEVFFNTFGCPSNDKAPSTVFGFLGPAEGATASFSFLAQTEPFRLFLPDSNTGSLHFRVYFETCTNQTYNADLFCRSPCQNPRTSAGRRRRQVVDEPVITASVRVYDPNAVAQEPQETSIDTTMMYVGVSVAAAMFFVLICVVACALVLRSRRRRSKDKSVKVPPQGFVNNVQY